MTVLEPSPFHQCLQGKAVCTVNGGPGSAVAFTYSYVYLKFFFTFPIPGWISLSFRGKEGNGNTVFCQGCRGGSQFGWQYVTQGNLGENAFSFHWTFWSLYLLKRYVAWKRAGRQTTLLLFSLQTGIGRQFCMLQLIISPSVLKIICKSYDSGFSRNVINSITFLAGAGVIVTFWIEVLF